MPHSCPFPYYCPANSSAMKSCEGGSMPVNTSRLRGSKSSCCSECDGGTYRPYLSPIQHCLPCPPGYFCPPGNSNHCTFNPSIFSISWLTLNKIGFCFIQTGTDHYKSNPCPLGYVCLMGTTKPMPCPPGFFGNLTNAESMSNCHPCPAGTFNHLAAQKACFPCGSSSTSPAGRIPSDNSIHVKLQLQKSSFLQEDISMSHMFP